MSLREIARNRLKKDEKGRIRRWFQGDDVDLFTWEDDDGNIIRHQFTFGISRRKTWMVDWDPLRGVRTGEVDTGRRMVDMEDIVSFYLHPSSDLIDKARSIVADSTIDPKVRQHFLEQTAKYVGSERT